MGQRWSVGRLPIGGGQPARNGPQWPPHGCCDELREPPTASPLLLIPSVRLKSLPRVWPRESQWMSHPLCVLRAPMCDQGLSCRTLWKGWMDPAIPYCNQRSPSANFSALIEDSRPDRPAKPKLPACIRYYQQRNHPIEPIAFPPFFSLAVGLHSTITLSSSSFSSSRLFGALLPFPP